VASNSRTKWRIDPWTASDAIRKGQEPNELKVVAQGPVIAFYVNDEIRSLPAVGRKTFAKQVRDLPGKSGRWRNAIS
jgi:hypothetical protein